MRLFITITITLSFWSVLVWRMRILFPHEERHCRRPGRDRTLGSVRVSRLVPRWFLECKESTGLRATQRAGWGAETVIIEAVVCDILKPSTIQVLTQPSWQVLLSAGRPMFNFFPVLRQTANWINAVKDAVADYTFASCFIIQKKVVWRMGMWIISSLKCGVFFPPD